MFAVSLVMRPTSVHRATRKANKNVCVAIEQRNEAARRYNGVAKRCAILFSFLCKVLYHSRLFIFETSIAVSVSRVAYTNVK